MKYSMLLLTILLLVISCGQEEEVFVPIEKVTDTGKEFSIESFKQIGFKQLLFCIVKKMRNVCFKHCNTVFKIFRMIFLNGTHKRFI